jgi:hypothetical protein
MRKWSAHAVKLELVMKEQGLATSGAVDPQSAAKVVGCSV